MPLNMISNVFFTSGINKTFTIQMWKELDEIGGRNFSPSVKLGIDGRDYNDHNGLLSDPEIMVLHAAIARSIRNSNVIAKTIANLPTELRSASNRLVIDHQFPVDV